MRTIRVALLIALLATSAAAVEIEPNVIHEGGTRVEASELGVSFTVPKGWRGAWPQGAEAYVMESPSAPGVMILGMGEAASAAEVAAFLAAPIDLGDGVTLQPKGAVSKRGRATVARFDVRGSAAPAVATAEALVGAHGISAAFILIAPPAAIAAHEPRLAELISSTRLVAPEGAAAAGGGGQSGGGADAGGDRWDSYLRGKYIVRYYTASGYTDEQHLWLCSDGSFHRKGAAGGFGGGASGAFQSNAGGRWTATGAGASGELQLHFPDGGVARYALRWDFGENKLYVDGKRWLHGTNEVCD